MGLIRSEVSPRTVLGRQLRAMLERHIMKQIMGPTRSPSEPVGLHLEVELKPQLKSHVGQKMAAMLMTQVRNGRGQKLMGLARARDPRILRAAGHASTTTTSKSSPHARTQENGSRNHSYFIAYEDRVHIKLVRARIPHQHILADRRLGTLLYFSIVWHLIHRLRNRPHETAARIFASTPPYRSAFRPRRTQQKVSS